MVILAAGILGMSTCNRRNLITASALTAEWIECRNTSYRCQQKYRVLLQNNQRRTSALMRLHANLGSAGDCT
jgi:hypothetical protein